jgi:hypothetical protein
LRGGIVERVPTDFAPIVKCAVSDERSDRPPTFQDVAHLVAGSHPPPPPWLAKHLEWWASSLRAARIIDEHRPTKVLMKKKLDEIKSAALLLQRALSDTPTGSF